MVEKILFPRKDYQLDSWRIKWYLERYPDISISESSVSRILKCYAVNRLHKKAFKRALHSKRYNKTTPGQMPVQQSPKRIAKDLEIEKLPSHVSRRSFAYFVLSSGATVEEISHAMGHSSIEMTQNYLKQFPSKYSDNAIRKFEAAFEI